MSFIQLGESIFPYNVNEGLLKELPLGTYSVIRSDMQGFGVHKEPDMKLPEKLYGNVLSFAERVLTTFQEKQTHMGVLLEGEKGSGKSLQAKAIIQAAAASGFSTLKVEAPYRGTEFNSFLAKFPHPFVLLFDEFEKVYDWDDQSKLLSLFDGTSNSVFLAILTVNDVHRVNHNIVNRPGRAYYRLNYGKLEDAVVKQFCHENLRPDLRDSQDSILDIHHLSGGFNFDMLQCLIEEMNRYGETDVHGLLKILNIDVAEDEGNWRLSSIVDPQGAEVVLKRVEGIYIDKNPLLVENMNIGVPGREGSKVTLRPRREHLDLSRVVPNQLTFVVEGYTIIYNYTPPYGRYF